MAQTPGLSDQGFAVKRLQDIVTDGKAYAQQVFQDLVPLGETVDTSDDTILGRLVTLKSPAQADLWEAAALVYSSFDPQQATGNALDNICAIGGVTRLVGAPSSAQMQLVGSVSATADTTFQVQSQTTGNQYQLTQFVQMSPQKVNQFTVSVGTVAASTVYTATITPSLGGVVEQMTYTSDATPTITEIVNGLVASLSTSLKYTATLNTDNSITVKTIDPFAQIDITLTSNLIFASVGRVVVAVCTENGANLDPAGSISTILTSTFGINTAVNLLDTIPGRLLETDDELRTRFRNSKSVAAVNTLDSIYSAINSVPGITQLLIYENDTDVTDSNGIPAHSFMPVVQGGSSSLIAQAIWSKKPTGIRSFGDTVITVVDSQGLTHNVAFKRPTQVRVYITVNILKDSTFPATGAADITSALVSYINELLIGQSVIYSRLYSPINTVQGFQINSMFIGTSASPTGTSNIPISIAQVAYTDPSSIIVNVS